MEINFNPVSFPKILLYNFKMFDGIKNQLQNNLMLLINNDRIQSIEKGNDTSPFKEYKKVNMNGMTVMPGLIDNHVHITVPFMYSVNFNTLMQMNHQIIRNFKACILSGVTTVRDVGGFPGKINKYRGMSDNNKIPGPRIISSLSPIAARKGNSFGTPEKAPYFTNKILKRILGGNFVERPSSVDEIEAVCNKLAGLGAQWFKTFYQEHPYTYSHRRLPNHSDEGYRKIIEIAGKYGLKSAMHQTFVNGFKKGVDLGFHTLEHIPIDGIIPNDYIEKFKNQGMAILPTIMAFGDALDITKIQNLIEKKGKEYLMPEAMRQITAGLRKLLLNDKKELTQAEYDKKQSDYHYEKEMFPNIMANLKKLYSMGVTIGIGTDSGGTAAGFFGRYTEELKYYKAASISGFDILRMATSVNAAIIDRSDEIGTLEAGKLADIIAVKGNPLNNPDVLNRIEMVIKGGVFITPFI